MSEPASMTPSMTPSMTTSMTPSMTLNLDSGPNIFAIMLVAMIWIITLIIIFIINLFVSEEFYQIYDSCDPSEVKYRYLIRVVFNPMKRNKFKFNKNTITFRVHNTKETFEATFVIKTMILAGVRHFKRKSELDVSLMLNRKEIIPEWGFVTINTEGKSSIYLYSVRIISIDTKQHFWIPIDQTIKSSDPMAPNSSLQLFTVEPQKWTEDIKDGRPQKEVEFSELITFGFWSSNLNLLLLTIIFQIYEDSSLYIMSVNTTIAVFFIQTIIILFYRFKIKVQYWKSYANIFWTTICRLTRWMFFIMGIIFGFTTIGLSFIADRSVFTPFGLGAGILFIMTLLFVISSYLLKCQLFTDIKLLNQIQGKESINDSIQTIEIESQKD